MRFLLPAALAALMLGLAAAPASAIAIKHTSRVDGDPDAPRTTTTHSAPPVDTSGVHYFDKAHETGARG